MAARAFHSPLDLPQARPAQRGIHPRVASAYKPAPLAAMSRRTIVNAAAHEAVLADIRLAGWLVVSACCIGLGLALGLHFDEILHDVRLLTFNAEEPRWLWSMVDSL